MDGLGGILRRNTGGFFEDLLDPPLERSGERERQRQARVVFSGLDRIHRLTRNAQSFRQVRLRPLQLSAQDSEPVLHRYRKVKMAVPSPQRAADSGRI